MKNAQEFGCYLVPIENVEVLQRVDHILFFISNLEIGTNLILLK